MWHLYLLETVVSSIAPLELFRAQFDSGWHYFSLTHFTCPDISCNRFALSVWSLVDHCSQRILKVYRWHSPTHLFQVIYYNNALYEILIIYFYNTLMLQMVWRLYDMAAVATLFNSDLDGLQVFDI